MSFANLVVSVPGSPVQPPQLPPHQPVHQNQITVSPAPATPAQNHQPAQPLVAQSSSQPQAHIVKNNSGLPYTVGKFLAQGNFGMVNLVTYVPNLVCCTHIKSDFFGKEYVIKTLKTNRPRQEVEADWKKEIQILYKLVHPNIIR